MIDDLLKYCFLLVIVVLVGSGCRFFDDDKTEFLFEKLPSSQTKVTFSNDISYDRQFNIIEFSYIYNGGGVAAGDINNDGLTDLYFSGNMVSSRLYLNKGNFEFEDITEFSGTGTDNWAGGVSMVDINHDGYLDIYVSVTGSENSTSEERKNLLFINNGDSTFTESADEYGLADTGYTTHAAFFDYDKDGDLDVYLMNNFGGSFARDNQIGLRAEVNDGTSKSADALYRNNGDGSFTDVSERAGILKEGYSLGLVISDINRDGLPDIYVSNDVQTDDLLYINNGDGTFSDRSHIYFKYTSYAGMGADVADFNNDGWPDVLQVDMLPPSLEEKKQVTGSVSYDYLQRLKERGYQQQYTLNTLQLSNGMDRKGNIRFSEIGQLAGVDATDWSWSALFGDYDNDGLKDIMITNGYPKAVNNYDYLTSINRSTMFGSDSSREQIAYDLMDELEGYGPPNYFFKNKGNLTFEDVSEEWGFTEPSYSYGAVQADLDNDGDLDIVINDINSKARVYRNRADTVLNSHYLKVDLKGDSLNTFGIGAKLILTTDDERQYQNFWPYRGYQSTMDTQLHFGLGSHESVDSLRVIWPDGRFQILENIEANQTLTLNYEDARSNSQKEEKTGRKSRTLMTKASDLGIDYEHRENGYVDFNNEPLLPYMLSRLGPGAAVGDINNDNREDIYLGGATGQAGKLFVQQENGTFRESGEAQPWQDDGSYEDTDALFLDANGDGRQDLYVVSGGNSYPPASEQLQDRLYLNSGNGNFVKADNMLPRMYTSGSVVKAADYDDDGDQDLFVGGRHVPGQYPKAAQSYILRNDGGKFTNITESIAPELVKPGLLTDAVWVDFNNDGELDLVTTGIWMPVSFFENNDGQFQNVTSSLGMDQHIGWWQSIEKADLNNDGDIDFVVGNLGMNFLYSTSGEESIEILVNDFDGNQQDDAIIAIEKEGQYYPLLGMRSMSNQLPKLARELSSFEEYAASSLPDMFGQDVVEEAESYTANYFANSLLINEGGDSFSMEPLPNKAQLSSLKDVVIIDINGDGHLDLVAGGNIYNTNPEVAPNNAGNGSILLGDGNHNFAPISPFTTGFLIPDNVRKLLPIKVLVNEYIIVVNNDNELKLLNINSGFEERISSH